MDFMRLLKSVEELLYELVTWILFYPLTLWRCILHPQRMMAYAEAELKDDVASQYDDALSPPIFLLITIFVAHIVELATPAVKGVDLPAYLSSEQNLLLFRAVSFCLFPLVFALTWLRLRDSKVTRQTLRAPFYAQCFVTAPFVLAIDLSVLIGRLSPALTVGGFTLAGLALVWYLAAQTRRFTTMAAIGWPAALGLSLLASLAAFVLLVLVAWVTVRVGL